MLCPYCGKEMTKGFLQCRDGLWWSEKERPVAALPFFSGERIDLSGGAAGAFSGSATVAWCCKGCEKIIVDYSEVL